MAMEGTLKNRNGKLYVLYTYDEFSEPFRQFIWYRVLETRGSGYGERPEAGDIATSTGYGGEWKTSNPSTQRTTGSVSTGTGSTQAELVERVSIPPPAASGKKLRWRDGRWEKRMVKGWLPAGEGKTQTSKTSKTSKKSTNHATAKRQHATKKKSPSRMKPRKGIRRASMTTDYFRGQTYGDVEWDDGSVTSGPLNAHMRALLDRARREGQRIRHKTIGP